MRKRIIALWFSFSCTGSDINDVTHLITRWTGGSGCSRFTFGRCWCIRCGAWCEKIMQGAFRKHSSTFMSGNVIT
jgi:hypothetical protein